jgi:hypothetical protein
MKTLIFVSLITLSTVASATTYDQCVQKGRAYEKEAGVFVKPAVEVRCERVKTSFDFYKPYCIDLKKREEIRKEKAKSNPSLLESLEVEWKKADKQYPKCSN